MTSEKLPGTSIASRPLHFIWLADCSGSMEGDKIEKLNYCIRSVIPTMKDISAENVRANVLVRAIKFGSIASWHIAQATPIEAFEWVDLEVKSDELTAMGGALRLVAEQLKVPPMASRALPPVLVLVSDGQPNDDFSGGLSTLLNLPWGQEAVRVAIAIGRDADSNLLGQFTSEFVNERQQKQKIPVLVADNATALEAYIRWASTNVLKSVVAPPSQIRGGTQGGAIPIPEPPVVSSKHVLDDIIW